MTMIIQNLVIMVAITPIKVREIIAATEIQTPEMVTTETIIRIKDQATIMATGMVMTTLTKDPGIIMATGMVMTTLTKDPEIIRETRIYYKITFEG